MDVDCLSFDRVLLFLEAAHLGREPPHVPAFQLEEMLQAARSLGLRSLEDHCMARLVRCVRRCGKPRLPPASRSVARAAITSPADGSARHA